MTSSNGNIFPVNGHLCGEFTGDRWIPRTKASVAEFGCFLWSAWINGCVNNREVGDLRRRRAHYDVIVIQHCSHHTSVFKSNHIWSNLVALTANCCVQTRLSHWQLSIWCVFMEIISDHSDHKRTSNVYYTVWQSHWFQIYFGSTIDGFITYDSYFDQQRRLFLSHPFYSSFCFQTRNRLN